MTHSKTRECVPGRRLHTIYASNLVWVPLVCGLGKGRNVCVGFGGEGRDRFLPARSAKVAGVQLSPVSIKRRAWPRRPGCGQDEGMGDRKGQRDRKKKKRKKCIKLGRGVDRSVRMVGTTCVV